MGGEEGKNFPFFQKQDSSMYILTKILTNRRYQKLKLQFVEIIFSPHEQTVISISNELNK